MIEVSRSWIFISIDKEVISLINDVMNIPNIIIVMQSNHSSCKLQWLENEVSRSFDREILFNHYLRRLLWRHQTSHRNWVIIMVSLGYSKGLGWGVWSRPEFVYPCDGEILWGPTRWDCIIAGQHLEYKITEASKQNLSEQDWTKYCDIDDRISDKLSIDKTKGLGFDVYGSANQKIFAEFTGVIMGIQVPLIIIDRSCLGHVWSFPEP